MSAEGKKPDQVRYLPHFPVLCETGQVHEKDPNVFDALMWMIAWTQSRIRRLELNCTGGFCRCELHPESMQRSGYLMFLRYYSVSHLLIVLWKLILIGELPVVKTLGLLWSPNRDEFKCQVHRPSRDHNNTKCAFEKRITTVFDPLGFLVPYVVRAKVTF